MKLKDKISIAVGVVVLLGAAWGSFKYLSNHFDTRYALAQEVKQNVQSIKQDQEVIKQKQEKEAKRLDYKILSDQVKAIQERIWKIQDRIEQKKKLPDEIIKEELRALEISKIDTQKKLDTLEKETK